MKIIEVEEWSGMDRLELWSRHRLTTQLSDGPVITVLKQTGITMCGNSVYVWWVTITDRDAVMLRLKYPDLEILQPESRYFHKNF